MPRQLKFEIDLNNGNILQSINTGTGAKRFHSWDEENRMKLVVDQQDMGYYLYDGGGERTVKIIGQYSSMSISGEPAWNGYLSNKQTLYVNPYLVVNNKEYTKHYYIENQRIVSKLGGGFVMDTVPLFHMMFGFHLVDPHDYNIKKHEDEAMVKRDLMACGQPGSLQLTIALYNFLSQQPTRNDPELDIFYYHGDHLGSTSYITDVTGMPSQHVDYLPFGEVLLEEKTQTWQSPYKFNCKEQDEESGLNYYGARYMDSKWAIWLGVDPMADKYPSLSPFSHCMNNPVRLIDPDGRNSTNFLDENGNLVCHIDDGSNAVFQKTGTGTELHYSFQGYDDSQNGANGVNLETAIQEQECLNMENPSLQQNAEGNNETHCNQATQNVMRTVASTENDNTILITGRANGMAEALNNGNNTNYLSVEQTTADQNAQNGGLSLVTYSNPRGSGHIAPYSVGTNRTLGTIANIGPSRYTGFVPLNTAIGRNREKNYFIFLPNLLPTATIKP